MEHIQFNPDISCDVTAFLLLLKNSLSLSFMEKRRIISMAEKLSEWQVTELTNVFMDEQREFAALEHNESEATTIKELRKKAQHDWDALCEHLPINETLALGGLCNESIC